MYCSKCGQPIGYQPVCPRCGALTGITVPPAPTAVPSSATRVARHLRTVAVLWIIYGIYTVLHWLVLLPFLRGVFAGHTGWFAGSDTWMYGVHPGVWLLHVIAIAVYVRAILSVLVGYALLTRQSWGRIFAIVIAILTLIKPFTGTALAIYTLWVLCCQGSGEQYDRLTLTPGAPMA